MAPLAWTALVLGLTTLSAGSPLRARQETVPTFTASINPSSGTTPITTAEDFVATIPTETTTTVDESTNTNQGIQSSLATPIVDGTVMPGGSTDAVKWCETFDISCEEWVGEKRQPQAYWALRAVSGLQSKLDAAHAFLVDETLEAFLDISRMVTDFSAPESDNSLETFAGLISSCLFVVGGVAGLVSVGTSYAGAAAASAVGYATAAINQANARNQFAGKANAEKLLEASKAKEKASAPNGRAAAAMGGSTYLLGSTFGLISAATDPDNQVPAGLLEENLKNLFSDARDRLADIGKLATGQGGDYSLLPHQEGVGGIIGPDAYIAGFFSNGRMLFGESNSIFQESLEATFGAFRTKLVDIALQSAGFLIMSPDHIKDSEACADSPFGGYGSQWIDFGDGNSRCMQMYREATKPDYEVLDQSMIDLIQGKYCFNMFEYCKAAYDCNKNGAEGGEPDLFALPTEERLPTCFYNINAQSVKVGTDCTSTRCEKSSNTFELSDF